MPSKVTVITVFAGMIAVGLFSFIMGLYEKQDKFRIENLPYKKIKLIEVDDRGLLGNKVLIFNNIDTINKIKMMMKSSKEVQLDSINLRSGKGLCEIKIHIDNNKTETLVLSSTSSLGGIISSGGYYYRNNELLDFIINKLKSDK